MIVTDIADEIQSQMWSRLLVAQEHLIDALGWFAEPTWSGLPAPVTRFAQRFQDAPKVVDRGFEAAEGWLRNQRQFAANIADALAP